MQQFNVYTFLNVFFERNANFKEAFQTLFYLTVEEKVKNSTETNWKE